MDDGEVDDIEWENECTTTNTNYRDGTLQLNLAEGIDIRDSTDTAQKQSRKRRKTYSTSDYEHVADIWRTMAIDAIGSAEEALRSAVDITVLAAVSALLPDHLIDPSTYASKLDHCRALCEWVRYTFELIPVASVTKEEGRDGACVEDLIDFILPNRAGTSHQICQILISALTCVGYKVRLVRTLDFCGSHTSKYTGISCSSGDIAHLDRLKAPNMYSWVEIYVEFPRIAESANEVSPNDQSSGIVQPQHLLPSPSSLYTRQVSPVNPILPNNSTDTGDRAVDDVDLPTQVRKIRPNGSWTFLDPTSGVTRNCRYIEEVARKDRPLDYVLAYEPLQPSTKRESLSSQLAAAAAASIDESMMVIQDVTSRYKRRHKHTTANETKMIRLFEKWLKSLISDRNVSCIVESSGNNVGEGEVKSDSSGAHTQRGDAEQWTTSVPRLDALSSSHPLPTTFIDFKDHPFYLLERFLRADQVLHPTSARAVAIFKGERVYLRQHAETLRTKLQWRRLYRQVTLGAQPIKIVRKRILMKTRDEGECDYSSNSQMREIEVQLFGSWQTQEYKISPVIDDVIPVNKYGNIEVWDEDPHFVPVGAEYVDGPGSIKCAQELGIPFVPAVTRFERRGLQTNVPIIGGAVVLWQFADVLRDAVSEVDSAKIEKTIAKQQNQIFGRWARIVRGVLSREHLRERYGH